MAGQRESRVSVRRGNADAPFPAAVMLACAGATAVVVCVVALVVGGGLPVAAPAGLLDAGAVTGWMLRLAGLLTHLAAAMTVGSLMVGALLVPAGPTGRLDGPVLRAVTHAGRWAGAWAVLAAVTAVLTVSDVAGVPLLDLRLDLVAAVTSSRRGVAWCLVGLAAGFVALVAGRARDVREARVLLVVAVAGLMPTLVTGHASAAADPGVVTSGLVVHVIAAMTWTGGLAGIVLHLRRSPDALALAIPRFSTLALAAYVALAASGVLTVSARLDMSFAAWTSGYGALVVAKMVALVALGGVGHLHRRRTIPRLTAGRGTAPFLRLAGAELTVMGAGMGLATALARTPVPPAPVVVDPIHGPGHSTLPGVVDRVSLGELATAWRPDAVVLLVLGLLVATYFGHVRIASRTGRRWPMGRSAAFVCGVAVAVVDLCSGVATYAPAMVSVQVSQLLVAMLVVPTLLLYGAPVTLWLRAGGAGPGARARLLDTRVLRWLANPVLGAAACSALLLAVYRTPLIEVSLRSYWTHLAVLVLAVASGLMLLWPALGVDPVPEPRGAAERISCLAGLAMCLALLAVQLRRGDGLLAAEWFLELRWGWVDPVADQRVAGLVVGMAAVALMMLTGLMAAVTRRGADRRG